MRLDSDEEPDALLDRVTAELRRPMRLDPALDERVLRVLRTDVADAGRTRRLPPRVTSARWAAGIASGALAAGLVIALIGREPRATRPIELRLSAPASQVVVVGDFNDWDPDATPLRRGNEGGTWRVELQLPPGRYRYTFLIDGRRWVPDPAEPRAADDDFGAPMSVLTVS
jgi:Glycogen recognition site of AMP-activated protein kinase